MVLSFSWAFSCFILKASPCVFCFTLHFMSLSVSHMFSLCIYLFIYLFKSMFFFHFLSVHLFQSSCLFFVSCTLRWLMGELCVPAFIPCGFCVYSQFMYFPFFCCWILFSLVLFPALLLSDFLLPAFGFLDVDFVNKAHLLLHSGCLL